MKRDYNLWRLLLRQLCDGTRPPELETYEEQEVIYNSALLVNDGYVDGQAIQGGSGQYVSVVMQNLTNRGHDMLEQLEAENRGGHDFLEKIEVESQATKTDLPITIKSKQILSIFISHSAKDKKLASALVALLRNALNMPAAEIRCTSVNGYRLPIGANTEDRLRQEVREAKAFIGLITPSSIASAYVMFELGARWGARLHLAPLLGAGAGSDYLRGPLSSLNALNCEDVAQVHQLISDLTNLLGVRDVTPPAAYQSLIDELVEVSKSEKPAKNLSLSSSPAQTNNPWLHGLSALIDAKMSDLNQEEIQVLKLFSNVNESGVPKELISKHLKSEPQKYHPLKIDQILERLEKRNLLYMAAKMGLPAKYQLTSKGRDYLIENNLL